jgi:hypothetical protein
VQPVRLPQAGWLLQAALSAEHLHLLRRQDEVRAFLHALSVPEESWHDGHVLPERAVTEKPRLSAGLFCARDGSHPFVAKPFGIPSTEIAHDDMIVS